MKITKDKLTACLIAHEAWLREEWGGIKANLIGADLSGADLSGTNLRKADLVGANLVGANLVEANLVGADLNRANLVGANLHGADLSRTDLHEADLRNADLSEARLVGSDLRGANLRWANLTGADLLWANRRDADFRNTNQENQPTGDEEKMTDLTQYPIGTIFLSRNDNRFKLIAVDDDRNYPIHCRHSHPGMVGEFTFTEFTFTKTGRFRIDGFPSDLDLVSVEKPLDLSNLGFGDLVERTDGVTGCVTRTANDSLKIEWQDNKPTSIVTLQGFKGANRIVKTIKFHHPRPGYTCTATVDVEADSEAQARAIMGERLNCAPDNVTAKKKG